MGIGMETVQMPTQVAVGPKTERVNQTHQLDQMNVHA